MIPVASAKSNSFLGFKHKNNVSVCDRMATYTSKKLTINFVFQQLDTYTY